MLRYQLTEGIEMNQFKTTINWLSSLKATTKTELPLGFHCGAILFCWISCSLCSMFKQKQVFHLERSNIWTVASLWIPAQIMKCLHQNNEALHGNLKLHLRCTVCIADVSFTAAIRFLHTQNEKKRYITFGIWEFSHKLLKLS